MKPWMMGGLVAVFVGIGAYLMVTQKETPPFAENILQPPSIASSISPNPPAPIVLAQVVEVTDLDSLLDPPEKTPTGAPFDADATFTPVSAPNAPAVPDRIPPAVEDKNGGSELSFFGHKLRLELPDDSSIETIFIYPFKFSSSQSTPYNGIEEDINEELARLIEQKTPFKVISDQVKADTTLIGRIVSIQKNILNVTQESTSREGEVVMTVDIVWRDARNGKILSRLKPGQPFRIVARGRYICELGETSVTALQRAENDVAGQIVSMMEKR